MAPHLIGIHCIAHREALAASGSSENIVELQLVDKFANQVYKWVDQASKQYKHLMDVVKSFREDKLEILRYHRVCWLSRRYVMERLVVLLPAILNIW